MVDKRKQICSYDELKIALAELSEDEYREFTAGSVLGERPILGVRIPKVRELAKKIPSDQLKKFLAIEPVALEEVLARGFLVARLPYIEMLSMFDSQVDYIDNWCTCDVFCSSLKLIKKHRDEFLEVKIDKLLRDRREFAVRVGLVLLKCYFVDFDYLMVIFDRVEKLANRKEYYIRMAIAWLVAECFIKYPDETLAYMRASRLPKWTYNKTISKICDSYRVDKEMKKIVKEMRK